MMGRHVRELIVSMVVATALSGCGGNGSGRTSLLVSSADPSAHAVTGGNSAAADPRCTPSVPPASTEPLLSSMTIQGPCHLTETGNARCVKRPDDFYVYLSRDLPGDGRFILTVNVEGYHGSAKYGNGVGNGAEIYIEVTRNGQFYYWTVRHAAVAVDESSPPHVDLETAHLPAQAGTPARGTETISGTVGCPNVSS